MAKFKGKKKKGQKSVRYSLKYEKILGKKRKKVYNIEELEEKKLNKG